MEFGNASWGYRELPLEEQLAITRDLGLGYLELGIANAPGDLPLTATVQQLEEVKALYRAYGIALTYAATGNDFTTEGGEAVRKVKAVCSLCRELGVTYLRIFAGFSPVEEITGERWDSLLLCLQEVGAFAREQGVTLTVETHGGVEAYEDGVAHYPTPTTREESLARLLGALPQSIALTYDPANLMAAGVSHPQRLYTRFRSRIASVHLKDFAFLPSGHCQPVACGEGALDWDALLTALADYPGVCLLEYEKPQDVALGTRRCLDFLKSQL